MKMIFRLLVITCFTVFLQLAGIPGIEMLYAQPDSSPLQLASKTLEFVDNSVEQPELVAKPEKLEDKAATTTDKLLQKNKPLGQPLIISNFDNNKLYKINAKGEITWELDAKKCVDLKLYPNGNILFSDADGVRIVTPDKEVILDYRSGGSEVWGCLFMPNGNILVSHNNEKKIVEIDEDGNKLFEFSILSKTSGHDVMRAMTLTPQNTVLIGHKGDKVAREYNLRGYLLNEFRCPDYVQHAERLPNGNTLVTWEYGVWEFNKQKEIVWKLEKADVPEINISWLICSQRLPNGNTLISNWAIKEGVGHALFMVDKEKNILWKSPQSKVYNGTTGFHAPISDN